MAGAAHGGPLLWSLNLPTLRPQPERIGLNGQKKALTR
jgi:hypothetical protein